MKKLAVILSTLFFAAACSTPPTNRDAAAPANANAATEPASVALTEDDAVAKERAVWDTIKNKDYDAFAASLAADHVEVLPEGVMDKDASVTGVKQFEPSEINFSEWKYVPVGRNAFVVTYLVAVKGKFQGKEFPEQKARASSAWVKRDGKWWAIYHQETPAKPAAAPPAASKAEAAKPAASPAESPAPPPATGTDPIANEKIVWDLFKSKNYDAFAELLAPEFIQVRADNTFDRAAAMVGVKMFDASKVVQSDWKAANLNDEASLVTYTMKGPAPFTSAGERAATIWVKRDGKWLALLHHGETPVRPAPPPPPAPKATPTPAPSPSPAP